MKTTIAIIVLIIFVFIIGTIIKTVIDVEYGWLWFICILLFLFLTRNTYIINERKD